MILFGFSLVDRQGMCFIQLLFSAIMRLLHKIMLMLFQIIPVPCSCKFDLGYKVYDRCIILYMYHRVYV